MTKTEFAYFRGQGFAADLKQMSAADISYLIDLLVEELAGRIDEAPSNPNKETENYGK